eukprot:gene16767-biopygen11022
MTMNEFLGGPLAARRRPWRPAGGPLAAHPAGLAARWRPGRVLAALAALVARAGGPGGLLAASLAALAASGGSPVAALAALAAMAALAASWRP